MNNDYDNKEEEKIPNHAESVIEMTDDYNEKRKDTKDIQDKEDKSKNILADAGNNLKAGAKAVANKVGDISKDLGTEYRNEKEDR